VYNVHCTGTECNEVTDSELDRFIVNHKTIGEHKLAGIILGPDCSQKEKNALRQRIRRRKLKTGAPTTRTLKNFDAPARNPPRHDVITADDGLQTLTTGRKLELDIADMRQKRDAAAEDHSWNAYNAMTKTLWKMEIDLLKMQADEGKVDVKNVDRERLLALCKKLPKSILREALGV